MIRDGHCAVRPRRAATTSGEPASGRSQLTFGDLVEQRLVADLEDPRRLGPIPADPLEYLRERVTLGFARAAPRDLAHARADRLLGRPRRAPSGPQARHLRLEVALAADQHDHAADHVLPRADVPGPGRLGQEAERPG